jgi:hypothetical protein
MYSSRPKSPERSDSVSPINSKQIHGFQESSVIAVTEAIKSKPRSRSLIRRTSRKTKQQIREAHADDCNIS